MSEMSRPLSVAILLRHGQREDYIALEEGCGEAWVEAAPRPWDPRLAECGRRQAAAAAKRIRAELIKAGLPQPSGIYCSPLFRCVETADIVAGEFDVEEVFVEQGLVESVCEPWMRQFAVPGANAEWGGGLADSDGNLLPVSEDQVRREALEGPSALLRNAEELKATGGAAAARVATWHDSLISLNRALKWGNFESESEVSQRVLATVKDRCWRQPGETLIFVSHGGPTQKGFKALTGKRHSGEGGMTALSILVENREDSSRWLPLVDNDASHGDMFHLGVRTLI